MDCDRCGARARYAVTLVSNSELLFCAHHYRENALALVASGACVEDLDEASTHSR
jgi:hypothetical protein